MGQLIISIKEEEGERSFDEEMRRREERLERDRIQQEELARFRAELARDAEEMVRLKVSKTLQ